MPLAALFSVAALVFVATSFVVTGDTAGKLLTQGGENPFFVAWSRFALGAALILPFSGLQRHELRFLLHWRVVLRSIFIVGGICSILTALRTEPIANVFGAFFIGPIISYGLAVLFLGETISRMRTILLFFGFFGVMLVVKPGFGATPGLGFALLAGCCYGSYLTMTRAIAGNYRPRFLLLSQLVLGALLLSPVVATVPWPSFTPALSGLILMSAVGSALGNYILVLVSRKVSATIVAPLIYSQLITATALGVLVFGDWPDTLSFTGLAIILASGLGSLFAVRLRATA